MSYHQHLTLLLCSAAIGVPLCRAADLAEIIRRGTATIRSDWAADPDYAYIEKDEVLKNGIMTSKTSQVVLMDGSDYYLPLAVNDQPLSPERETAELEKMKSEFQRRNNETPAERRQRVEKYQKQENENGALLLDFPSAFNFELTGEGILDGHPAYVLAAMPKKRAGPLSLAAKVLSGMHGTLWIDKEGFHVIRAKCDVGKPIPLYGILARVLPGTHIEFSMAPVNDSTWLVTELAMDLTVAKLYWFKSKQVTRTVWSDYRPNDQVLRELLAKADAVANR